MSWYAVQVSAVLSGLTDEQAREILKREGYEIKSGPYVLSRRDLDCPDSE
jgi:hypothetical protein